jgi:hypothetical protein
MIRMNRAFVHAIRSLRGGGKRPLVSELKEIARGGIINIDGCSLLAREVGHTNATVNDFPDKTGFECFVNHIHLDEYASEFLIGQTICFVSEVLNDWNKKHAEGELNAIVGLKDGATVRFHRRRENEFWLAGDLDGYNEAILEISSSDTEFFDLILA